jgi:hypothetical protein
MRIRPVGAELFHADGRTDRPDEADSCFSQFCQSAFEKEAQLKDLCCILTVAAHVKSIS